MAFVARMIASLRLKRDNIKKKAFDSSHRIKEFVVKVMKENSFHGIEVLKGHAPNRCIILVGIISIIMILQSKDCTGERERQETPE